ncbi:hypothetical protein ACWZEH_17640 [Streptomyces sp. QTS137]
MTAENTARRKLRPLAELTNIHEFLDEVRQRPSMWIHGNSLHHLESMLAGYRIAMEIHGVHEEEYDFWSPGSQGPFTDWLRGRLGRESALRWATEIEREAEAAGVPAVELFFSLLDEYRAARSAGRPMGPQRSNGPEVEPA